MHSKYPALFSPIEIGKGGLVFKNRIWTAPTGAHLLSAGEPYPNEATIAHYREKARGGAACITFSCQNVDRLTLDDPMHSDPDIYNTRYHNYWYRLTSAVHFFDARISLELLAFAQHGLSENGAVINYGVNEGEIDFMTGDVCPAITPEQMHEMAHDYAEAARIAVDVGFDMIMLHFGHGVYPARFLSPKYNRRTDDFGGNAENRARFPVMILDAIRESIGPRVPIEVRVSGDELTEGGGTVEDCIGFLRMIEDRIDLAHISCGTVMDDITQTVMHPVEFYPPGVNAGYARSVKESGLSIPVLAIGAFQRPELIEETIASGGADVVALARGAIADAQTVNKAREGREAEITPCIKCFYCLAYDTAHEFACSVNPTVGREYILDQFIPAQTAPKKKIVIIGGGPAGMAAAIFAAQRGHEVVILEQKHELGGKIVFARKVPFKYDLDAFLEYQISMVESSGVTVKLGVTATPEMVAGMGADVIFAAVGSDPLIPPIPVADGAHVVTAEECFANTEDIGRRVIVIGGGEVGCETALYLTEICGRDVSILEMREGLALDACYAPHLALNDRVPKHAKVFTSAKCNGVSEASVSYLDAEGVEHFVPADTVILSAGMRARKDLAESFRDCAPLFFRLGDCMTPKNIRVCTRSAFDAVLQL
jgi:2,4-dienoyl-CoA reductase-like NADH-dependent reductase (Old Yellow Enzyme family)/thioredoxin reductase